MTTFSDQPDADIEPHVFDLCRNFHIGDAPPHCSICNREEADAIHRKDPQ